MIVTAPSAKYLLKDYYDSRRRYVLEKETNRHHVLAAATDPTTEGQVVGFGAEIKRPFKKARLFAALYTDDETLWLQVEGARVDLFDRAVSLKRRTLGPMFRRVEISLGSERLITVTFWLDLLRDGFDPGEGDFFSYVALVCRDSESLRRYLEIWRMSSEGIDKTSREFGQELERRLASQAASPA